MVGNGRGFRKTLWRCGRVAGIIMAGAMPDGQTLLIVAAGFAINPSLRRKLPYDTLRAVWLSKGEMK